MTFRAGAMAAGLILGVSLAGCGGGSSDPVTNAPIADPQTSTTAPQATSSTALASETPGNVAKAFMEAQVASDGPGTCRWLSAASLQYLETEIEQTCEDYVEEGATPAAPPSVAITETTERDDWVGVELSVDGKRRFVNVVRDRAGWRVDEFDHHPRSKCRQTRETIETAMAAYWAKYGSEVTSLDDLAPELLKEVPTQFTLQNGQVVAVTGADCD